MIMRFELERPVYNPSLRHLRVPPVLRRLGGAIFGAQERECTLPEGRESEPLKVS